MKSISLKASLAAGLAHRMRTMDGQTVVDACAGYDEIAAVRANLSIADAIDAANGEFMAAVKETEDKKRSIFTEVKAEYDKASEGKTREEATELATGLQKTFNERAAEVQKESKAKPDVVITFQVADEKYSQVLMPIFKKTVQLWDLDGTGSGQKLFLEVADALEAAIDV